MKRHPIISPNYTRTHCDISLTEKNVVNWSWEIKVVTNSNECWMAGGVFATSYGENYGSYCIGFAPLTNRKQHFAALYLKHYRFDRALHWFLSVQTISVKRDKFIKPSLFLSMNAHFYTMAWALRGLCFFVLQHHFSDGNNTFHPFI